MPDDKKAWLEKTISEEHINYIDHNKFAKPYCNWGYKYKWKDCKLTVDLKCLKVVTTKDEKSMQRVSYDPNVYFTLRHSKNILIHHRQPNITDFGLSKQMNEMPTISNSIIHGILAYIGPKCFMDPKNKGDNIIVLD
ncbi:kinase-like protein [Gigaspora margarita]|uniref:Kinase-like protein n=1 Tax=Gigaspora margarita TaxID=4874 RepID=A0A8H4AWC6_GIGMA|nr:kinase-like protein [Gigaspora margarita]